MRNTLLFFLIVAFAGCKDASSKEHTTSPPLGFEFELFGEDSYRNNLPCFVLSKDDLFKVNLRISSKDKSVALKTMLQMVNEHIPLDQQLRGVNFDLQKFFHLQLSSTKVLPCTMYHAEPMSIGQDGQRLVLWFQLDKSLKTTEGIISANLIFNDPIFNHQELVLPLGITTL